ARNKARAAARPINTTAISRPCNGCESDPPCGYSACHARKSARFRITPTTAALVPEIAPVNLWWPCVASMPRLATCVNKKLSRPAGEYEQGASQDIEKRGTAGSANAGKRE